MHHIDIASFWPGYTVIAQALSANHHTLFAARPRADLLPRCRRCLQPTPLITTNVSAGCVSETYLTDKSGCNCLFAASTVCAVVASVNISTGSPLAPALTRRMQCWIEALVQYLPIRHVSQLTGVRLAHHQRIDKRRLQTSVGTIELGEVRRLVMDEFALHKGHRYATVIMDAERDPRPVGGARQQPSRYPSPSSSSSASDASRLKRWRWT